MKDKLIHELINKKEKRFEIEVALGISAVNKNHLSKMQLDHIKRDKKHNQVSFKVLNQINNLIKLDENTIKKM